MPQQLIQLLKEGDLVFRQEGGTASRIFARLGQDPRYAHGGIVLIDGQGSIRIAHAFSADWMQSEPVHLDSAEAFLDRAATAGIYRAVDSDRAQAAAKRAWEAVRAAIPFDRRFDLHDRTAMYCTELLWWAYGMDREAAGTGANKAKLLGVEMIPVSYFTVSKTFQEIATCGNSP